MQFIKLMNFVEHDRNLLFTRIHVREVLFSNQCIIDCNDK